MIYYVKEIFYNDKFYNIILQQQNGSCPLVCICNIFILRGILSISNKTTVTSEQLFTAINSIILDIVEHKPEKKQKYEEKYANVIDVISTLEEGINVDIHFDNAKSFGSNAATDLFLLCGIQLIHGWLPDPKSEYASVKKLSYDVIEEQIAMNNSQLESNVKSIPKENENQSMTESLIDEKKLSSEELTNLGLSFIHTYPTQLSEYGLQTLQSSLKQDTFFAFFRNNHFSILLNHKHQIYTLITDIGYANRSACVWERIDSIHSTTLCKPDLITPYQDAPISASIPQEAIHEIQEIPQDIIGVNKSIEEIHKEQVDLERTIIHNAQTHHTIDDPNVADLDESGMKDANQENDDARIAELLQAEEYEAAAYQRNKCEIM